MFIKLRPNNINDNNSGVCRCNRLICPLARLSGLNALSWGHNGHGINLYGFVMILIGNVHAGGQSNLCHLSLLHRYCPCLCPFQVMFIMHKAIYTFLFPGWNLQVLWMAVCTHSQPILAIMSQWEDSLQLHWPITIPQYVTNML